MIPPGFALAVDPVIELDAVHVSVADAHRFISRSKPIASFPAPGMQDLDS
jgi:hypothetical protein